MFEWLPRANAKYSAVASTKHKNWYGTIDKSVCGRDNGGEIGNKTPADNSRTHAQPEEPVGRTKGGCLQGLYANGSL